ncbi:MAG: hypothetical protein ACOYMS_10130 [Terrimicrobiaceae bacterium]
MNAEAEQAGANVTETTADLRTLRPMDAVAALYATDQAAVAAALVASLGKSIFEEPVPKPTNAVRTALAGLTYRVVKQTTKRDGTTYRNRLLERSGHPYAQALLASSRPETQALVEGGDPMNAPYMMIAPEIRENIALWDNLFFNSVQSKDVQLRFIWETRTTHELAKTRLTKRRPVRLKALAGGTGLSMILAYDRLIQEGGDPTQITCEITDRDTANTAKTNRLLAKLAAGRGWKIGARGQAGISAYTEDIFAGAVAGESYDVVTTVGILEYLQGHTCETTERRQGLPETQDTKTALDVAQKLTQITATDASVIVNSYKPHPSIRILELFGKMYDYRTRGDVDAVLATGGFRAVRTVGSAHIYDVIVYEKSPAADRSAPRP